MIDRVTDHAKQVVNGEVVSGKLHFLACKRHLDDLKKDFEYYFNVNSANIIVDFAETLTLSEGTEPKPLKLLDTQVFDFGCLFGWKKKSNQKRRFRRSYISEARQNGKTLKNGVMGTYIAEFGGYKNGKLFTVATKKRQSRLAWEQMKKFIEADSDLSELFKIKDYISTIYALDTNCTIEALSKEAGLDDGFRSIFSSIDELHQHRDNKIYKALYNGTRALDETLVSMITTRGDRLNSFCKEMDDYCIKILKGLATAEDFFVDIYTLDEGDDIKNPQNWIKANPFICTNKEMFEQLKKDAQTAFDMGGSDLRDFMTKSLNMWVQNTDDQFIDTEAFKKCGSDRTLKDFIGQSCWVGLDLSSGGDLTTISLEFDEDEKIYFYSHSFMPRGRIEEHIQTDIAPYDLWEQMNLITVTGGSTDFKNDYKFIIRHLKELQETYDLKFLGIGIDPHNADGILSDLEDFGSPVMTVTQSAKSLNDATVDIQLLCKSGKLEYDKENELLIWSFVNAATVQNSFGEIKVDKKVGQLNKRIDPVDACIDAHHVKMKLKNNEPIDVEDEMDKYLASMGW